MAYPSADANRAALELERLTARLGLDTAPRWREERDRPDPVKGREAKAWLRETTDYRKAQIEKSERRIDAPPDRAAAFLVAHEAEIAAIRRHLLSGDTPRWEMRMDRLYAAPIPNLLGHIDLQKLLVTDALFHARQGRREVALDDLEAAWNLMQALADDPMLIVQLITISDARMILGLLRQIPAVPARFGERLRDHDFRGRFLTALRFEAWVMTEIGKTGGLTGLSNVTDALGSSIARPYVQLCLAHTSDALRRRLDRLAQVEALCDYDLAARGADLDIHVPRWNAVGRLILPQLSGSLDRLAQLELDIEMTTRILDLERERIPRGGASSACPADRWTYEVVGDGDLRLALQREVSWPGVRGARLPASFTIPRE